jgi:site-specific recombinase XerD
MTKLTVEAYLADLLAQGKSPATVNRALASIRWWARKTVDMAREDPSLSEGDRARYLTLAGAVADIANVRDPGRPLRGRAVASGELAALMDTCKGDRPADVRDAAIIALAWTCGPRRSEIATLDVSDIEPTDGGCQVTIRGKGGKVRQVHIGNGAADALADWLAVRGDAPGPVFLAITKGNQIQAKGCSPEALAQMLDKRAQQAGVKSLSWHDMRRTVAGDLLDDGTDIATVARVLGHASVQTTARYDRRDARAVQKALDKRHVPYNRRPSRCF